MFMGGAGKQLALTAAAMADRGHDVALFTYIGESMEHNLDPRIRYIVGDNLGNSKLREYINAPLSIRSVIKGEKPDVIVSWRANAGCMAVLGSLGLNTKVVFSERSDPYMETNWMLRIATKICDLSDGGVFQTNKAKEYYRRLNNKSIVCPNPVDASYELKPISSMFSRKKEIAWVGRFFNVQKRMDVAVKTFKKIHSALPDYFLSFFGDGVDENYVKKMVKEENLQDFVKFHGATKNIIDVICNSRLLMLSSDYEGIPNVVIEAFMAGTPVVATDCSPGGVRVLIDDNNNGFVVPVHDVDALAEKSIELIRDDEKSLSFVKNGREKLKEFDSDFIFDRWNQYLIGIVS